MGTGTGLVLKISMFPAVWPEPVPISSQALSDDLPDAAPVMNEVMAEDDAKDPYRRLS